jgi:hypothetical protein
MSLKDEGRKEVKRRRRRKKEGRRKEGKRKEEEGLGTVPVLEPLRMR